jgi:hypothetical protein
MTPVELVDPVFGRLRFPAGAPNRNPDRLTRANCTRDELELLAFFDSRGIGGSFAGSLAQRLLARVGDRVPFLLVCRPLELTTWASLFNFIATNALAPRRIVTNMGFVDYTPKKKAILDDAVRQVEAGMGPGIAESHFVENYLGSDGQNLEIFAMTYGADYARNLERMLSGRETLVINTPLVPPQIKVPRQRPRSFFTFLEETNRFNRSLRGVRLIEPGTFDETQTYDGVHYTDRGNELIFGKLAEHL